MKTAECKCFFDYYTKVLTKSCIHMRICIMYSSVQLATNQIQIVAAIFHFLGWKQYEEMVCH